MKTTQEQRDWYRPIIKTRKEAGNATLAIGTDRLTALLDDADSLAQAEAENAKMLKGLMDEATKNADVAKLIRPLRAKVKAAEAEASDMHTIATDEAEGRIKAEAALGDLRAAIARHARDYRLAAEMDSLPEGDLGWRYHMRATADTFDALLGDS